MPLEWDMKQESVMLRYAIERLSVEQRDGYLAR